jgi:hypothetical protein
VQFDEEEYVETYRKYDFEDQFRDSVVQETPSNKIVNFNDSKDIILTTER